MRSCEDEDSSTHENFREVEVERARPAKKVESHVYGMTCDCDDDDHRKTSTLERTSSSSRDSRHAQG